MAIKTINATIEFEEYCEEQDEFRREFRFDQKPLEKLVQPMGVAGLQNWVKDLEKEREQKAAEEEQARQDKKLGNRIKKGFKKLFKREDLDYDQMLEDMEANEDEVECQRCFGIFPKEDCTKDGTGRYVCQECLKSESLQEFYEDHNDVESPQGYPDPDNAVVDCKTYKLAAHSEDEKPVDCKMEKKPLDKPLTEAATEEVECEMCGEIVSADEAEHYGKHLICKDCFKYSPLLFEEGISDFPDPELGMEKPEEDEYAIVDDPVEAEDVCDVCGSRVKSESITVDDDGRFLCPDCAKLISEQVNIPGFTGHRSDALVEDILQELFGLSDKDQLKKLTKMGYKLQLTIFDKDRKPQETRHTYGSGEEAKALEAAKDNAILGDNKGTVLYLIKDVKDGKNSLVKLMQFVNRAGKAVLTNEGELVKVAKKLENDNKIANRNAANLTGDIPDLKDSEEEEEEVKTDPIPDTTDLDGGETKGDTEVKGDAEVKGDIEVKGETEPEVKGETEAGGETGPEEKGGATEAEDTSVMTEDELRTKLEAAGYSKIINNVTKILKKAKVVK